MLNNVLNVERVTEWLLTPLITIGGSSISVVNILELLLWLLLLVIFCRLLKNFLRERLLVRLKIDKGNREAISTIITYFIGTLGAVMILQATGFRLASLVVIAGGLGVGIGFGLQDATKNFVSGLTLLIERTVKVDDFVEFDGMIGYVKSISLRSTIIRTRDGGDVVVPNSHLVENRLLNWSYESFTGRIHIPVGVAYGSDPLLVTEILLKSAYMDSSVLHDPPPDVMFTGFGDHSLNFALRVWINRIDKNNEVTSALNFIVEYNLRQHGITIPFPQQDLWLRNPEVLTSIVHPHLEKDKKPVTSPSLPLSIRDLLRQINYFENFSDLELRLLIEVGHRQRLNPSEVLFREGDPGDAFYIILSGSVEVFVEKIDKHLTILEAGNFFGELSLLLGIPRTATVRALESTLLFSVNKRGFEQLLQKHPELSEVIVQALGKYKEELVERQKQLREMGLVDASEDDKNPIVWVRNRLQKIFSL